MDKATARKLKVGAGVYHLEHGVFGKVIEVGYAAIKIKWTDGQVGTTHPLDMKQITEAVSPVGVGL